MIKSKELRTKNNDELNNLIEDLEKEQIRLSSFFSQVNNNIKELKVKGATKSGTKTSAMKNVKRLKAKCLTILNERKRDNDKLCSI